MNRKQAAELQAQAFQRPPPQSAACARSANALASSTWRRSTDQAANDLVTRMRPGTIVDEEEIESIMRNLGQLVAKGPKPLQ
jgi:hypothetical protein